MGGTIRVIKKENNKLESYTGYTNYIPVLTFTNKFYTDKSFVRQRLLYWGDEDKTPNFNRTEYGVIFIDIDSKRIYSCQGYCTIGKCSKVSVSLAMSPNVLGYEYVIEGSKEFINDGTLIYKSDIYDKIGEKYELVSSDIKYVKSHDDLIKMSEGDRFFRKDEDKYTKDDFYIDLSKYGWEINSWLDSKPFEFFSKLIEDGYNILDNTDFSTWNREDEDEGNLESKIISLIRDNKLNKIV